MQSNRKKIKAVFISFLVVLTSCSDSATKSKNTLVTKVDQTSKETTLIRSDYKSGEIAELCKKSINSTLKSLDSIAALKENDRTIDNTLLALESATSDLSDQTTPLTFMGYVSTDTAMSAEGSDCEATVGQFYVEIFTRRDLYVALQKAVPRNEDETRLLKKTLVGFEQNGLKLSDEVLAQLRELKGQLSAKETQFSTNLNSDKTSVTYDLADLQGLPKDYIASLKIDASGKLIVNTKESDYPVVMQNAVKAETRQKMLLAYLSRGGDANTKLLTESVALRAQIAHLMGFKNWADYRTDGRMAQNSEKVLDFLTGLKKKLALRNQDDFAKLLAFKKESLPEAKSLNQEDVTYYSYQLKKRDYSLDNEKIREYFPADVVIAGLFQVYSKMLGVRYEEITTAKIWATDVKLYAIHDASDDHLIGYFYTDFFPREGKYGHAAAFPLIAGRTLANGQYSLPVSSIVANLSPPMNGKPSLLDHGDVDTIFHEFGHIMHQTLTKARYASLSGSNVAQDFVEAPSQMLENWVWNKEILNSLSGHYLNHAEKLPNNLLEKMIAAREFNQAYGYTKQLLYALFDMTLHTQESVPDVNKIYLDLYREVLGQEPRAGQQFPASFGHLMGGYDAGYYGYLWSEVYAQDMFTQFPEADLASPLVGSRYRKNILEKGNMKEALDLLRDFLGREPNSDAFFKKLHI
jgi:thimet oligopeptidase